MTVRQVTVHLASIAILSLVLMGLRAPLARSGIVDEEYIERNKAICEPRLLERRAAEATGRKKTFLEALLQNAVQLRVRNSVCSGTFITPTCVLTAAHCVSAPGDSKSIQAWRDHTLAEKGIAYVDKDFMLQADGKLEAGKTSGDDIAVVVFPRPYKEFHDIGLSAALGNLNLWFSEAEKPDSYYGGDLARFDRAHWRDLGALGLTGFAQQSKNDEFATCSDSAFEWAPCFVFQPGWDSTPSFERGVICTTAEAGSGMSGGPYYNESTIFGVLVEEPARSETEKKAFVPVPEHYWVRHPRAFFRSNLAMGFANRVKVILPEDRDFILTHCPDARFDELSSRKGPWVRDKSLIEKRDSGDFWLPGGVDPWRQLKYEDRVKRISRPLKPGDHGEFVRRLELRLRALKFLRRQPDLEYGVETETAVLAFQKSKGLPATGRADPETLRALGLWFEN